MDGEKETIIMDAAEVISCFFRRENIHNRPEISEHVHTRVPEIFSRFAANKQAQSMREGGSVFSRVWADNTPSPAHHT